LETWEKNPTIWKGKEVEEKLTNKTITLSAK
jgi:hypothetical protein